MHRLARAWILVAPTALVLAAQPARADVTGPCTIRVAGIDMNDASTPGDAVAVPGSVPVELTGTSEVPVRLRELFLEIAGVRMTLAQLPLASKNEWTNEIHVQRHSRLGVGVYKVISRTQSSRPCEGVAFIRIVGNPLSTIAGLAGAAAALLGALLLGLGATLRFSRDRRDIANRAWAEERLRWRPRLSPMGVGGGLLLAGGILVLLQQYAVVYPTVIVVVVAVVLGVLAGFVPSIPGLAAARQARAERAEGL